MKDYAIWCADRAIEELYEGDTNAWDEAMDRVMSGEFKNVYTLDAYMKETRNGKE